MSMLKLQQGLLVWFNTNASCLKSLSSIENTCFNLYRPYPSPEISARTLKKAAREHLFLPLLRHGVVEFYGNGKYSISPSAALCSNDKILFCNIPWKPDNLEGCLFDSQLGIEVYKKSPDLLFLLDSRNISSREFSLFKVLSLLPSIEAIINSWEDDLFIDSSNYLFLGKRGWTNAETEPERGIFKKSDNDYSQRVLKMSETEWKQIPLSMNNPDSFGLAYLWAQQPNDVGVFYNMGRLILRIISGFFPVLVERLLLINTLLGDFREVDISQREYFVSKKEFDLLNKLFGNKIAVI